VQKFQITADDAKKECDMLKKLKHPRIVGYFGHKITTGGKTFLIFMEFMEGGSLRNRISVQKAPFAEKTVIQFTRQILKGLAYVHNHVVTHGDLKCMVFRK
jgi:serine/threonine protein kinase